MPYNNNGRIVYVVHTTVAVAITIFAANIDTVSGWP